MNAKITAEHRAREALVYVRQSTPGQVLDHTESQRRQYALADTASAMGFASVAVIDDDLGRSGSGMVERPGFQKLVSAVCSGSVGAVFCIEASRLARNGRDWHHLIDLCALAGALVIDPDSVYDPRLINDRLLLGLKGTMSEYELSLLRQRGLAARDAKAQRGQLRFTLPPGYCWDEAGRIEIDPDERIADAIALVFRKFRELGSARQVLLWWRDSQLQLPVWCQSRAGGRIEWRAPAYHTVLQILQHPMYAGAYVFGRTGQRTLVVEGRARKSCARSKPMPAWNVLLREHHRGFITWEQFEEHQQMIAENAHMQRRASRKAARGGQALLTGLARCARCGRMLHVFYGMRSGHAHRYQCRGDDAHSGTGACLGIGGVRVDRAVADLLLQAVSECAVDAAIEASERAGRADADVQQALARELEAARYDAALAARRYEAVDPAKRLVARELESRWNAALERVAHLEQRIEQLQAQACLRPAVDRAALLALARELPAVWNAEGTDMRTKQRLMRLLVQEVVIDLDESANEAVVIVHWSGGQHTEVRVARVRAKRSAKWPRPSPVNVLRRLGGQWPDRELAVTMNRMRCRCGDGKTWTTMRVRELRERLGIAAFDPTAEREETISVDETARRLQICVQSVYRLIREGLLPATHLMRSAPWQVPLAALTSDRVQTGVQAIIARRPRYRADLKAKKALKLPSA